MFLTPDKKEILKLKREITSLKKEIDTGISEERLEIRKLKREILSLKKEIYTGILQVRDEEMKRRKLEGILEDIKRGARAVLELLEDERSLT